MRPSRHGRLIVLIKLFFAVMGVAHGSLSDSDGEHKRTRGISDLGTEADVIRRESDSSSLRQGPNGYNSFPRNTGTIGEEVESSSKFSYQNSEYFREYLALGTPDTNPFSYNIPTFVYGFPKDLPPIPADLENGAPELRRLLEEASEGSAANEKRSNSESAAFVNGSDQLKENGRSESTGSSSLTTSSPPANDVNDFDTPTLPHFELPPATIQALHELNKSETSKSGQESDPQRFNLSKPSYREVLETRAPPNSPKGRKFPQAAPEDHKKRRAYSASSAPQQMSLNHPRDLLKKSDPILIETSHKQSSFSATATASHYSPTNASGNRCPASSGDICKVISKSLESRSASIADRSGSDLSNISFKSHTGQPSGRTEGNPVYIPQTGHYIEAYSDYARTFRMPRDFAPPTGSNVFKFPYNEHGDPKLKNLVKQFRTSLTIHNGKRITGCEFEDFEPELDYSWKPDEKLGTKFQVNNLPIKVFDTPPMRTWIPVRCEALGVDFKLERNVKGHAGKGGGKAHVSIVYDAKKTDKKVLFVRKEYYDLEYFTNEYNFFQFAHHPHLPKPLCVEYGEYPRIVMEHVEGERIHLAFYDLGKALVSQYPKDPLARWEHMTMLLGRVLGKLLVTIKYIHSIGFIHGDLKPENIIFNLRTGRIAIIDFDLSVSAPYTFAGRGTEATIAPEVNGLLRGPVHFGIDWWAYGSTAAILIAVALAGTQDESNDQEIAKLLKYVPFKYNRASNTYEMTPIPSFFPPVMRSFLYPFFNPDPSKRVFSEAKAYNWIRGHPMFSSVENWRKYENLDLGPYAAHTSLQLGFKIFSNDPVLLKSTGPSLKSIFRGFSSMFKLGNVFNAGAKDPDEDEKGNYADEDEDDDDDEDDEDEEEEEEENENEPQELFKFEE